MSFQFRLRHTPHRCAWVGSHLYERSLELQTHLPEEVVENFAACGESVLLSVGKFVASRDLEAQLRSLICFVIHVLVNLLVELSISLNDDSFVVLHLFIAVAEWIVLVFPEDVLREECLLRGRFL